MKRQWKPILVLLLVLATLSSCAGEQNAPPPFVEVTQFIGPAPTDPPAAANNASGQGDSIFSNNPYELVEGDGLDGLGEEAYDDGTYDPSMDQSPSEDFEMSEGDMTVSEPEGTPYPYAGSSPIPLDPVDMPSPTPRTELVFAYVPYNVTSLGLAFEGPAGWVPDESTPEQFILTEPDSQIKDKQPGIVKIYASPVNSNYTEGNLKTEVQDRLKAIGSTNFDAWDPSLTASRFLMGSKGVYANYSGTMANGVKVGGRIHCTCIDNKLYTIEIVYPLGFKEDYLSVFTKMRETIKRQ